MFCFVHQLYTAHKVKESFWSEHLEPQWARGKCSTDFSHYYSVIKRSLSPESLAHQNCIKTSVGGEQRILGLWTKLVCGTNFSKEIFLSRYWPIAVERKPREALSYYVADGTESL